MELYKNVLIGTNICWNDWKNAVNNINKKNIIICNFSNINNLKNLMLSTDISYILPLSETDYNLIKTNYTKLNSDAKIIYPQTETIELLNNKNLFTEFMIEHYCDYIPEVFYLNGKKLKEIKYPAIYKPIFSTNASNMFVIHDEKTNLTNYNNIQEFISNEYEYAGYMLCIDGIIVNCKIIRHKFAKYNIKKTNFPNNYENVDNFDTEIFKKIFKHLNYSGGACINFKYDQLLNKIYIFEINPRFGGSAFTCGFIYDLLCIK